MSEKPIPLPWCIPAGEGNEHVVCVGDTPHTPGKILFVLRAPTGTRDTPTYEELAEFAAMSVLGVNLLPELVAALEVARDLVKDVMNYGGAPGPAFDCGIKQIDLALAKVKPTNLNEPRG